VDTIGLLNRANDGSAPILLVLWRAIRHLGPLSRERLLGLCAPASFDRTNATGTLNRWLELGLFFIEGEKIRLASPFDRLEKSDGPEWRSFRREVRRLVLAETSNDEFLLPEPGGAADLTFAASWLLSTDVFSDQCKDNLTVQRLEREQITPIGEGENKYAIQNGTRWNGFRDWAVFLGWGWDSLSFQLDPTEAIEDELDDVFSDDPILPVDAFVRRLGDVLPILDRGAYAQRARERSSGHWRLIQPHELSPALSRALLRIELAGRIQLEAESDAEGVQLLGPSFAIGRRVSHVQLLPLQDL
jgi:hypothetical protein